MHTIIDIRNDENGRVILEEATKDQIVNPLDLRCVYLEQLLGEWYLDKLFKGNMYKNIVLDSQQLCLRC